MQNLKTVDFGVAFTLTRPAPADYEDKDGNTQTAAANEPRFNYSNGVAQGLLLDASLSETAAIDDVPAFNASAGHWIIDAEFYNSEPLKGMGLDERFSGSGKMVVSYSGGTAKVWAGGQVIYTVEDYTPAEPTHICEGGMATIGGLTYKPSAISDADAAALATGDFEIYEWTPAELFEASQDGAWYDPSDLATLFQDAAGTIPVTGDGDPVGLMLDKSGNGHHASQPTTAAKPVYRTDGMLHWIESDGIDDQLVSGANVDLSDPAYTFYVAAKGIAGSSNQVLSSDQSANRKAAIQISSDATLRVLDRSDSLILLDVENDNLASFVAALRHNSDGKRIRLNGTDQPFQSANTNVRGVGDSIAVPLNGAQLIYGAVVINRTMADQECAELDGYLAKKAGVTLS